MKSSNMFIGSGAEVSSTGCNGAKSYLQYAKEHGYEFIEVLDWCSSAGDWQFAISKDGENWQILDQTNNYPRPGFTHTISDEVWQGTAKEVVNQIFQTYYS
jgi:hypothetical protein